MLSENAFSYEAVLCILNDKIPDGRDVSWVYDIEPELLVKACSGKKVYVSGTRSLDMQIRLAYAGVNEVVNLGELSPASISDLPEIQE